MENNVMLGAIDAVAMPTSVVNLPYTPTGGNIDLTPTPSPAVGTPSGPGTIRTGAAMVTLPKDDTVTFFEGGPSGGGGATPDLKEDTGIEMPAEGPSPMSKKNLLLYGIGGLVLAYLLLRKK